MLFYLTKLGPLELQEGHYFIHITSRHTSFGLDTQSRDLGAPRPMNHLIAPIEAVQSGIDYLQFWLTFTNNGRRALSCHKILHEITDAGLPANFFAS